MFDDEEVSDEHEGLYPLDLPVANQSYAHQIAMFFIEQDRKEKQVFREVSRALDRLYEKHGDEVSMSAISYVSKKHGWDMEILMEKHEVEDYLMNAYNLFDEDIWLKVVGTEAMYELRKQVFALSQTYLALAVQEALETGLPNTDSGGAPL